MGYHLIKEGQDLLMHELRQYLHALSSGKVKMTEKSASALALMLQQLEMAKLFRALESAGGIEKVLESLMGGEHGGGQHRQIGFVAPHSYGGIMPPSHKPMMEAARRGRRGRYRTRSDMPHGDYPHSDYDRMDMDYPHSDYDRYDLDADMDYADHDDHMEMARRRRGRRGYQGVPKPGPPRDRRFKRTRYEMDLDDDMRADTHNALVSALEAVTRNARHDSNPRGDTTHRADMRMDGQPHSDMPHSDTPRSDGQPTHRTR